MEQTSMLVQIHIHLYDAISSVFADVLLNNNKLSDIYYNGIYFVPRSLSKSKEDS